MKTLLLNLFLAVAWMAITGVFTAENLFAGFFLGVAVLWLVQSAGQPSPYFFKFHQILFFLGFFILELIKANLRVAVDVVTPRHRMKPGVLAIPLDIETDAEIMLLSTLITLTPGTLSLDVSEDRKILYIHAMYIDDPETYRQSVKTGFEARVLELFR